MKIKNLIGAGLGVSVLLFQDVMAMERNLKCDLNIQKSRKETQSSREIVMIELSEYADGTWIVKGETTLFFIGASNDKGHHAEKTTKINEKSSKNKIEILYEKNIDGSLIETYLMLDRLNGKLVYKNNYLEFGATNVATGNCEIMIRKF